MDLGCTNDLRAAYRSLRSAKIVTSVAVMSLALGIGAVLLLALREQ